MRFLLILVAVMCFSPCVFADELDSASSGWDSVNTGKIENALYQQKPVTDQQFEKTLTELKERKKRKGFWARKEGKPLNESMIPPADSQNSEIQSVLDMINHSPTIMIPTTVIDDEGSTVPSGFYKLSTKKLDNQQYLLLLTQGTKLVAKVEARQTEEDLAQNEINFGRAIIVSDSKIKLIYGNLDLNLEGYLYVKK